MLEAEAAVHNNTKEENKKLHEEAQKMEAVVIRLLELLETKKAWYNEQLVRERELTHQVEVRLNNEKGQLIERHLKETQIWAEMKKHCEYATTAYKQEILNLKNALQEAQNHSQVIKENVHIVLQTNREKFSTQLKTAMDKG